MNINKLIQTVFYLLGKYDYKINYTKLLKILYLADRKALEELGETITGDEVYSMDNGPVLTKLYDLIKGTAPTDEQNKWNSFYAKEDYDLICINKEITDGELCEFEESVIDEIDQKYHNYTFGQMIDEVHKKEICPEWIDPHGSSIYISNSDILKKMGFSEKTILEIQENNTIYSEEFKKMMVRC